MKGILQQYDVDAGVGYDKAEYEIQQRSRSRGDQLSPSRSEKVLKSPPVAKTPKPVAPTFQNQRSMVDLPPQRFNESLQTEKRDGALRAMQEAHSKAMQHGMDARFENQDRMINYLLTQLQGMESASRDNLNKANAINDKDREFAQKRILDLKLQFDTSATQMADLVSKVNSLQAEV